MKVGIDPLQRCWGIIKREMAVGTGVFKKANILQHGEHGVGNTGARSKGQKTEITAFNDEGKRSLGGHGGGHDKRFDISRGEVRKGKKGENSDGGGEKRLLKGRSTKLLLPLTKRSIDVGG